MTVGMKLKLPICSCCALSFTRPVTSTTSPMRMFTESAVGTGNTAMPPVASWIHISEFTNPELVVKRPGGTVTVPTTVIVCVELESMPRAVAIGVTAWPSAMSETPRGFTCALPPFCVRMPVTLYRLPTVNAVRGMFVPVATRIWKVSPAELAARTV